jgi:hypothetical protein
MLIKTLFDLLVIKHVLTHFLEKNAPTISLERRVRDNAEEPADGGGMLHAEDERVADVIDVHQRHRPHQPLQHPQAPKRSSSRVTDDATHSSSSHLKSRRALAGFVVR